MASSLGRAPPKRPRTVASASEPGTPGGHASSAASTPAQSPAPKKDIKLDVTYIFGPTTSTSR